MIEEKWKYPIGQVVFHPYSIAVKEDCIAAIRFLPRLVEAAIENLDEDQLQTPYRPGGWTVQQVVHHLADSHMNAFIRFKLGLSEENPTIKPYLESEWAQQADVKLPVNVSITLLFALHERWTTLLLSITTEEWQRTVFHPEHQKVFTLWELLQTYAWHGAHHVAHITTLKQNLNW